MDLRNTKLEKTIQEIMTLTSTPAIRQQSMYAPKYSSGKCEIALMVQEIFPDAKVIGSWIFIDNKPEILLPQNAVEFIRKFDSSTPAEREKLPYLEIEIPEHLIEFA